MRVPAAAPRPQAPPHAHGDARWVAWVIALIAGAILLAVAVNWFVGPDGTVGDGTEPRAGTPVEIASATDFDPHGTGGTGEHPDEVIRAFDGNPATAWTTEDYQAPLQELKPGVGIYFDLGENVAVAEVEIVTNPGISFQLRVADEPADDEGPFTVVEAVEGADATTTIELDGEQGRYWLVWITSLPNGEGGIAEVSEVKFFGG